MIIINWPPTYQIKRHRRAKNIKLRISKYNGLEITIPFRFNIKKISSILDVNREWILKKLDSLNLESKHTLPETIHLAFTDETFKIRYVEGDKKLKLIHAYNEISLVGKIDQVSCKKMLNKWLKLKASELLIPRVEELSLTSKLFFSKIILRSQKTMWGSCNALKTISLNYKLIFLPQPLVDYVIYHELAHTKYLNHSRNFWNLVEANLPNHKKYRLALKNAESYIPGWIYQF